ncbi:hypothetical protein ACSYGO_46125 [Streptomyces krungchingensis]
MVSESRHELSALAQYMAALHGLYLSRGEPSSRKLRSAIPDRDRISHDTVNRVLRGGRLPKWRNVELVITALRGDVGRFKDLWMAARLEENEGAPTTAEDPDAPPDVDLEIARDGRGFPLRSSMIDVEVTAVDRVLRTRDDELLADLITETAEQPLDEAEFVSSVRELKRTGDGYALDLVLAALGRWKTTDEVLWIILRLRAEGLNSESRKTLDSAIPRPHWEVRKILSTLQREGYPLPRYVARLDSRRRPQQSKG